MPTSVTPGPVQENTAVKEAVCVHTNKIYDGCRDKDCVEELPVYTGAITAGILDTAVGVRGRSAELLYVTSDIEPVSFNRGYYTVNLKYYYRIRGEAVLPALPAVPFTGLAVFEKNVILFGSEGSAKVFSSKTSIGSLDPTDIVTTNLPTAVIEAVDPVLLNMRLSEITPPEEPEPMPAAVPQLISDTFEDPLVLGPANRRVYVSLGQFSIIRLERDSQLIIPAYDYCMPEKECIGSSEDDPCEFFSKISFPVDEFFPPDTVPCAECYRDALDNPANS